MTDASIVPSIDTRYSSANLEKSTRIQSRQFTQITFAAMLSGLLVAMIGEKIAPESLSDLQAVLLSFGVPAFGLIVAAWVGHQDYMIGLLDSYCVALERFGSSSSGNTEAAANASPARKVPCWHELAAGWLSRGMMCRYWSVNAFGLVLLGTSLPNTLILYKSGHKQFAGFLLALLFTMTFILRAVLIPTVQPPMLRFKYHIMTALIAIGASALWIITLRLNDSEPPNKRLDYFYAIGAVSCFVSIVTLALYMYFERRRYLIVFYSEYDMTRGEFSVQDTKLIGRKT